MFKQGGGGENERKAVIAGSLPVLIQSVQLKVIATENTVMHHVFHCDPCYHGVHLQL